MLPSGSYDPKLDPQIGQAIDNIQEVITEHPLPPKDGWWRKLRTIVSGWFQSFFIKSSVDELKSILHYDVRDKKREELSNEDAKLQELNTRITMIKDAPENRDHIHPIATEIMDNVLSDIKTMLDSVHKQQKANDVISSIKNGNPQLKDILVVLKSENPSWSLGQDKETLKTAARKQINLLIGQIERGIEQEKNRNPFSMPDSSFQESMQSTVDMIRANSNDQTKDLTSELLDKWDKFMYPPEDEDNQAGVDHTASI